jgi:hypothetical protein
MGACCGGGASKGNDYGDGPGQGRQPNRRQQKKRGKQQPVSAEEAERRRKLRAGAATGRVDNTRGVQGGGKNKNKNVPKSFRRAQVS